MQLGVLMPRMVRDSGVLDTHRSDDAVQEALPVLRTIVEGAIRQLAHYIQYDPWANAFSMDWRPMDALSRDDLLLGTNTRCVKRTAFMLPFTALFHNAVAYMHGNTWQRMASHETCRRTTGRAGWVGTRNFEVDSGAYFFSLLWNYYHTSPGLGRALLKENVVLAAVQSQLLAWEVEQQHGNHSRSYMYPELHKGSGKPVGHTGMLSAALGKIHNHPCAFVRHASSMRIVPHASHHDRALQA